MIQREIVLNVGAASGVMQRIKLSQYDTDWQFIFTVYDGTDLLDLTDVVSVMMTGRKEDGTVFAYEGTIEDGAVVVDCGEQMTSASGLVECELRFSDTDGLIINTVNFEMYVEPSPTQGYIASRSEIDDIGQMLTDAMESIPEWVHEHLSTDEAVQAAEDAEAYAAGTRGGVDVQSDDPAYHNNSKYYKDQAAEDAAKYGDLKGYVDDIRNAEPYSDLPYSPTTGSYVNYANGKTSSSENFAYTDYIDLTGFSKIRYSRIVKTGSSDSPGIAFYTSKATSGYISGRKSIPNASESGYQTEELDVPSTAVYVRLTIHASISGFFVQGINGIVADIEDLKDDVSSIQGDVEDAQGDIEDLQGDVSTVETAVTTLSDKVDSIDPGRYDVDLNLTFSRASKAYDAEGNEVAVNVPVEERGGIVVTGGTTNLLGANDSRSISAAISVSLSEGAYTASVQVGKMTLAIGSDEYAVDRYHPKTFSLAEQTTITLTPITATCDFVQVEQKAYPTPWNLGGETRSPSWIDASLSSYVMPDKFGIGFVYIPYTDMTANYNGEYELLYVESVAGDIIRLRYPVNTKRISFGVSIGDSSYGTGNIPSQQYLAPKPGDPIGIYFDFEKGKSVGGWIYRPQYGIITNRFYGNVPSFGTVNRFQIGHRKVGKTDSYVSNGVVLGVKMTTRPDAVEYFKEVF